MKLWSVDSGYACGGVFTQRGQIVRTCPIYRKWVGCPLEDLPKGWIVKRVTRRGSCKDCPLQGRPYVPGFGPTNPDIAFVGESPGENEVQQGRPFVGKSGQFLRRVVRDLGIDEKNCYFTNTCMCHPPKNVTPKAAAAKACSRRLVLELAEIRPKLIVTLGKFASTHFAGFRGKMQVIHGVYRDLQFRTSPPFSVGVVPTYHPSGVLRTAGYFPDFVEDMEYVQSILEGQDPVTEPPYENYKFIQTEEEFTEFLALLSAQKYAALDLETGGMSWLESRILCAGFSWKKGRAWIVDWEALLEQNLRNLGRLNGVLAGVKLAMHNGLYDMPFLLHSGITNASYWLDTWVLHFLLDERQGTHSLERLAIKYYRAPDYKSQFRALLGIRGFVKDDAFSKALAKVSKQDLFEYNGADVDYTWRLAVDLYRLVKSEGQLDLLHDIEMPSARLFMEFTVNGMLIDQEYWTKLTAEWKAVEADLIPQIQEMVGNDNFNPNSAKQLAHHLYDVLELAPFGGREQLQNKSIPAGVIAACVRNSDDAEARVYWTSRRTTMSSSLSGFAGLYGLSPRSTSAYMLYWLRSQHPFPNLILRLKHVRKRLGLYDKGIMACMSKEGKVHPRYNLSATRTGRKQTSAPAIHNIPRGDIIYNIFIAPPGWVILHADYAQAEIRLMAHYSGDRQLAHILDTSDIHTRVAQEIFQLTDEEMDALTKIDLSNKRISAKMFTYGIPYGRSIKGLAPQLGVSVTEAQVYKDRYFALMPDLEKWILNARSKGVEDQVAVNPFGRRRRFPLVTDRWHARVVGRQAGNFPVQSGSNDLTLLGYVRSYANMRQAGIPCKPWPHIHDSVNFVVPKPLWKGAVLIIAETMEDIPFETEVSFPVAIEMGERWGSMVTVYENGDWVADPGQRERVGEWESEWIQQAMDL